MDEWIEKQKTKYYNESYILSVINDYLINAYDLFDGQVIDGLSYTMYNVEVIYDIRKDYTTVLFIVLQLLEKINKYYVIKEGEEKELSYWKEKLTVLINENMINYQNLEIKVKNSIEKNFSEIKSYILKFNSEY